MYKLIIREKILTFDIELITRILRIKIRIKVKGGFASNHPSQQQLFDFKNLEYDWHF